MIDPLCLLDKPRNPCAVRAKSTLSRSAPAELIAVNFCVSCSRWRCASAHRLEAGSRQISVAGPTPGAPVTVVALCYPTQATARATPMGPFTPVVAIGAERREPPSTD